MSINIDDSKPSGPNFKSELNLIGLSMWKQLIKKHSISLSKDHIISMENTIRLMPDQLPPSRDFVQCHLKRQLVKKKQHQVGENGTSSKSYNDQGQECAYESDSDDVVCLDDD